MDERTFERRIKAHYGITVGEFIAQRVAPKKFGLLAVAFDEAIKRRNPSLIIFLLKNYHGFSDRREIKQEVTNNDSGPLVRITLPPQLQEQSKKLEEIAKTLPVKNKMGEAKDD